LVLKICYASLPLYFFDKEKNRKKRKPSDRRLVKWAVKVFDVKNLTRGFLKAIDSFKIFRAKPKGRDLYCSFCAAGL